MSRSTRGGHRLLLRLGDDALGPSFCAARCDSEGADQLVLLRIFDRLTLSASDAWNLREARRPVEKALSHPSIGIGRGSGIDGDALWASYEYVQGYSLAAVLAKSRETALALPPGLALLVASKIAGALAAAARVEELGSALVHGFLVPELVVLSKEGAIRVLGFEVALALRSFDRADVATRELGSYFRPGLVPTAEPRTRDDLFGLGSMLSAMLTGAPFVSGCESDRLAAIAHSKLAQTGAALERPLIELLERCAMSRCADGSSSDELRRSLKEQIVEGDYRPSYHSLAVYLEELFREPERSGILRTRQIPMALAREIDVAEPRERELSQAEIDDQRLREVDDLFAAEEVVDENPADAVAAAEERRSDGMVDVPPGSQDGSLRRLSPRHPRRRGGRKSE